VPEAPLLSGKTRLNATDLVTALRREGFANPDRIVKRVFGLVAASLAEGRAVQVRGFGTFEVREHDERLAFHALTRDVILVPAKRSAGWRPSDTIKAALNQRSPAQPES
jgi:nucleoid DNA-binding protein